MTQLLLCLLAIVCSLASLSAQPKTDNRAFYNEATITEMLPGGETVTLRQHGDYDYVSYTTLDLHDATGALRWSVDTRFNNRGSGVLLKNIIPVGDSSFVAFGRSHECDLSGGTLLHLSISDGAILNQVDNLMDRTNQIFSGSGVSTRTPDGRYLLLGGEYFNIINEDFELVEGIPYNGDLSFGRQYQQVVAGADTNFLAIRFYEGPEGVYTPGFEHLQLCSDFCGEGLSLITWRDFMDEGRALDMAQADTLIYALSDQELVVFDGSIQRLRATPLLTTAEEADLKIKGGDIYVGRHQNDENYEVLRLNRADLSTLDTTTFAAIPGLKYHDFSITGNTIRAIGTRRQYETEPIDESPITQSAGGVINELVVGTSEAIPSTNIALSNLRGRQERIPFLEGNCVVGGGCMSNTAGFRAMHVTLRNLGTTVLNSVWLQTQAIVSCYRCNDCGEISQWRQHFTGLNLGPGEEMELELGELDIRGQKDGYRLCIEAVGPNDTPDTDYTDNQACFDRLLSTQATGETGMYRLIADRTTGSLRMSHPDGTTFTAKLYNVKGQHLGAVAGTGEVEMSMPQVRGVYFVVLQGTDGRAQTLKTVW